MFREDMENCKPLLTGDIILKDCSSPTIEELIEYWVLLKYTKERIESRLAQLRQELLNRVEAIGTPTDKGGSKFHTRKGIVLREKRVNNLPDEKSIRKILSKHNIPIDQAFSTVSKVVLDASKIQNLINLGKVPESEIEASKKVVWALRVKEAASLAALIDQLVGEPIPENPNPPKQKRTEASGQRKGE